MGEPGRLDADGPEHSAWARARELVRRIQRGDADAEAELVCRYQRGVMVIIARAGRGRVPVEDLCQDVLATAIRKVRANALHDPERLSGFIAGLARTQVIDYIRKEQSRGAIEARRPPDERAPDVDVVQRLLQQEQATIVRAVLGELEPERDREILFRFYLSEDDKESICRDLGLTPVHFNRVLFRARERYRELYRKWAAARGVGRSPR